MRTIRNIVFPIFNWGQACVFFIFLILIASIAIFTDPLLALHLGIGGYCGVVVSMLLLGLAPDEIEIREDEIGPISSLLAAEPFVHPIRDRVWAPARSRSWLFESDWISIDEIAGNRLVLKARKRDLKLILARIRPNAPH